MDMPRRDLWAARIPGQVYTLEQHSHPVSDGPALVFSSLIPDFDAFNNRGGRTLPVLHPDGSPNVAPSLLDALAGILGRAVSARDVTAYVAGVVAHPGFTLRFADELTTPGIRVPMTPDPHLVAEAVRLGEQVVWLHTYGERFTGTGRPSHDVRFPHGDARQPLAQTAITTMPTDVTYDAARQVVELGNGEFGPVPPAVWGYTVGGKNVIKSWVNYRKAEPGGKKTSPLDHVHADAWDPDWTTEFFDLLTVLTCLVELEPAQADLLERIVGGSLLTKDVLQTAGVLWPAIPADRKPHYSLSPVPEQPELDIP